MKPNSVITTYLSGKLFISLYIPNICAFFHYCKNKNLHSLLVRKFSLLTPTIFSLLANSLCFFLSLRISMDNFAKQYYGERLELLDAKRQLGINPYPHKFDKTMSLDDFRKEYMKLEAEETVEQVEVSLAGRVKKKFKMSSNLMFYTIQENEVKVQVVAHAATSGLEDSDFFQLHSSVKNFDIVGVSGYPGKTKKGELSIFSKTFVVLAHCLHAMPPEKTSIKAWVLGGAREPDSYRLKDQETRYTKRHMDLLLNDDVRVIFKARADIIAYIRSFLEQLEFLEVETPILNRNPSFGGARPFEAFNDELKMELFMRIAPELYLKHLVIGGLDRVFEIGKQFRCENIDKTHHPEFTTCEFYMAYHDYTDLMELTEKLLSELVKKLTGDYIINYHSNGYDKDPIKIDFTPPFRRIDIVEELENLAGLSIPKNYGSDEANSYLINACQRLGVKCEPPQRTARLLDKLADQFVAETCINPTFIMNHPQIMCHLAKSHRSKEGLSERFELYVNKRELINAYTESNDPQVLQEQFANLKKDVPAGAHESLDEIFCSALEYGLPPTAGWGIGIDRLVMLLTDSLNIKEVLFFPLTNKRKRGVDAPP